MAGAMGGPARDRLLCAGSVGEDVVEEAVKAMLDNVDAQNGVQTQAQYDEEQAYHRAHPLVSLDNAMVSVLQEGRERARPDSPRSGANPGRYRASYLPPSIPGQDTTRQGRVAVRRADGGDELVAETVEEEINEREA